MIFFRWIVLAAASVVALIAAPAALAGGIDRSFGTNGTLRLDSLNQYGAMRSFETSPKQEIYLLGSRTRCEATCSDEVHLLRLNPDGSLDRRFGSGGAVLVGRGFGRGAMDLAVDPQGRPIVSFAKAGTLSVARFRLGGAPDSSFSDDGVARLQCACADASTRIELDPRGGVFVVVGRTVYGPPGEYSERMVVFRLFANGSPDRKFGRTLRIPPARNLPENAVAIRDGSLVLTGSARPPAGLYLMRIRRDGTVDHGFGRASRLGLTRLRLPLKRSGTFRLGGVIPRARGIVDVVASTFEQAHVLRVLPSGHLDRDFGRNGRKRIPWLVDEVVPAGDGKVFGLGYQNDARGSAVFHLDSRWKLTRSFNGGRPLRFKPWDESLTLAMQGRRLLLFGPGLQECRGDCAPEPQLMRFVAPRRVKEGRREGR